MGLHTSQRPRSWYGSEYGDGVTYIYYPRDMSIAAGFLEAWRLGGLMVRCGRGEAEGDAAPGKRGGGS